jgi:hypothetical protein
MWSFTGQQVQSLYYDDDDDDDDDDVMWSFKKHGFTYIYIYISLY